VARGQGDLQPCRTESHSWGREDMLTLMVTWLKDVYVYHAAAATLTCTSLPPAGVANPIDRTLTSLLSLQDSRDAQCCTACAFAGLTLDRRFTAGMYFQHLVSLGRTCPGTATSDARLHRCRQALHACEELYMHAALSGHSSCTESGAASLLCL